ncbi:MAG: methyltransferase domain-containing protein [Candidatus Omnitrophica bacterium]|nr:methyltransferase domain-containing protein [Candidatus Omnitrophota bacterium]
MEGIQEGEFHCFFTESETERKKSKQRFSVFLPLFKDCRSIADLGCGEGLFLELLLDAYPEKRIVGVELNGDFIGLCRQANPKAVILQEDVLAFVLREGAGFDGFIMSDLIEHLDFKTALGIIQAIPKGAVLFIKTPNINSVLGHQFYLQTPGHKAPYSPFVLKKMLSRSGFEVIKEGEEDGIVIPRSIFGKVRRKILQFLFIDEFSRFFGGGNYFIAARKTRGEQS